MSGNNIYNTNTGSVGIGTAAPSATSKLDVVNASGHGILGYGKGSGSSYYGVYGQSGSYYAGLGRADGYSIVGNGSVYFSGDGYFGSRGMYFSEAARDDGGQFWQYESTYGIAPTCPSGSLSAGFYFVGGNPIDIVQLCQWIK